MSCEGGSQGSVTYWGAGFDKGMSYAKITGTSLQAVKK